MSAEEHKIAVRRPVEAVWNRHHLALVDELLAAGLADRGLSPEAPPTGQGLRPFAAALLLGIVAERPGAACQAIVPAPSRAVSAA